MNSFIADDGNAIYYKVVDNYSEKLRISHGVETIGRFIHYYNDKNEFIKMKRVWGTFGEMQNISTILARDCYYGTDE